jgi:anti-sigma factor RsiW
MMKVCEHVDSLLSAYLENEVSPAESRFLEDHLASCSRCRDQKTELRSLLTRLHSLPRVETSTDFTRRVLDRTVGLEPVGIDFKEARSRGRYRPAWAVPMAAAAAIAVLVIGVSQMRSPGDSGPMAQNDPGTVPSGGTFTLPAEQQAVPVTQPGEVVSMGAEKDGEWLDAYVLEDYELRAPAGGGTPTLTRVSSDTESKVVVTF